jgi:exonuclease V gamma subunit
MGKDPDKLDLFGMTPVDADTARKILKQLTDLYVEGSCAALQFAVASSFAYVEAWRKAKAKAGDVENEAECVGDWHKLGVAAADKKWRSTGGRFSLGEDQDLYLRQAFGGNGPIRNKHFAAVAKAVFEPMLDCMKKCK